MEDSIGARYCDSRRSYWEILNLNKINEYKIVLENTQNSPWHKKIKYK